MRRAELPIDSVLAAYADGEPAQSIAKRYNVSAHVIYDRLVENNIARRSASITQKGKINSTRKIDLTDQELAMEYAQGVASVGRLANKFGVGRTAVYARLRRAGIPRTGNLPGELNANWRGGKTKTRHGYILTRIPRGSRNRTLGTHASEHVVIAERALGYELPAGVEVHHVNEDKTDNRPQNLVICQDRTYHKLLHARQRILSAGGNPNTQAICGQCKVLKPHLLFNKNRSSWNGHSNRCRSCQALRHKEKVRAFAFRDDSQSQFKRRGVEASNSEQCP